jgi:hypothetical protein
LADGAPRSSSVLVEVAELPRPTKSKAADLMAMRHFEFRDEFSAVAARRIAALTPCGDDCRQTNHFSDYFLGGVLRRLNHVGVAARRAPMLRRVKN